MIDAAAPVRTAYYAALNTAVTVTIPADDVRATPTSTVIPVYSAVPDGVAYPYILLAEFQETGDGEARSKDNKNATDMLVNILVVTATRTAEDNEGFKVADDIANVILGIVLGSTPLTFTGIDNVTTVLEESTYPQVERDDTHLVIVRQLIIKHILSQS